MTHRTRRTAAVSAAAAALAALAAPGALAANPASLVTKPFTHKGYTWTMIVNDGGAGKPDSVTLLASKRAGKATQTHTYSFSSGVAFTPSADLASAKLVAKLGPFGSINLRFGGAGALRTASLPKPCTGPKSLTRTGTLAGRPGLAFVADSTFFGKVAKTSLGATINRSKGSGQISCGGSGGGGTTPPAGALTLSGSAPGADILTVAVTKSAAGAVTQTVTVFEDRTRTAPAAVFHSISVQGGGTFTAADDLSSAQVEAAGPFLSGALGFASSAAFGTGAAGMLSGTFTAAFDSIGPKSPAADGALPGLLSRG